MLARRLSRVVPVLSFTALAACAGTSVRVDDVELAPAVDDGSPASSAEPASSDRCRNEGLGGAITVLGALAASGRERPNGAARDSLTLAISGLDRRHESGDPVDDGVFAWSLWFAHDLNAGSLRVAYELGAGYSEHDVDGFASASLEIYRACAGLKATLEPGGNLPLALWARAGGFYRFSWDPDFEHEPFDQDGGGYYVGFGLDALLGDALRIGPFVDVFRGTSQDDLRETFVGVALTIGL